MTAPVPSACVDPDDPNEFPAFFGITQTILDPPDHGTVGIGIFGDVTYTSDDQYAGADAFVLVARDNDGHAAPVVYGIQVSQSSNQAPVCPATGPVGMRHTGVARVMTSCTDFDGDPITYTVASLPARLDLRRFLRARPGGHSLPRLLAGPDRRGPLRRGRLRRAWA